MPEDDSPWFNEPSDDWEDEEEDEEDDD